MQWVPLVDGGVELGPLRVIPTSHRWGLLPHYPSVEQINAAAAKFTASGGGNLGVIPDAVAGAAAERGATGWLGIDCPVPLGSVLLIHERLIHRSTPNTSVDRVRWSLDLRFCDSQLPTGRPSVPGFVARSHAAPATVAQNVDDWIALFCDKTAAIARM